MYHYDAIKIEAEKTADRFKEEAGLKDKPVGIKDTTNVPEKDYSQMLDKFLSGHYIVENIDYIYTADKGMQTKITLIRREWPVRSSTLRPEN